MEQEPPAESDAKKAPSGESEGASPVRRAIQASRTMLGMRRAPLDATGFFKPLRSSDRLARLFSELGLRLGRQLATVVRDDHLYLILMAAVVGVTSGAAAALLLLWIEYAHRLFPSPGGDTMWVRTGVVVLVPALGGLMAGGLRVLSKRVLRDDPLVPGVPGVLVAVANRGGEISGRSGLVAGLGTGITVGAGGSVGHEGPSVAIGATVGSVVARFFGLRLQRQVAMVGAGCAGGLAAAFNAPLAGVIFTVELIFGGSRSGNVGTMSVFIPLIVAAVAGTFTSHAIFGTRPEFDLSPHGDVAIGELGFYLLLAVTAGLIGTFFARMVLFSEERFTAARVPDWIKPALGGLGVGVLAAVSFNNEVLGTGRSTVDAALHGQLAWQTASMLIGLKMVATALTIGSGGFGGIFMPALFVGTCLGTMVGSLAALVLGPEVQGSGAYALVGMGAIFGALMHAPLTPIVMIFELTRDYGIILPLMLCCILSSLVARRVGSESFYRAVLQGRRVVLQTEADRDVMRQGRVAELMVQAQRVLTLEAGVDEVREVSMAADLGTIFVVDEVGRVVGYIDGRQLARRLLGADVDEGSLAGDLMATRNLVYLHTDDTLAGGMLAFARAETEELPVVDSERRLLGKLRRGDLIAHYSKHVLGKEQGAVEVSTGGAGQRDELALGEGVILERVTVARAWAGKTLAELNLRNTTGAIVLEWRRGRQLIPVDPHIPLREGDVVALVGSREAMLKARAMRLGMASRR